MVRTLAILVPLWLITSCMGSGAEQPPADTGGEIDNPETTGDDEAEGNQGEPDEQDACVDAFEPNGEADVATVLSWDEIVESEEGLHDARTVADAQLCASEHDWYRVAIAPLELDKHMVRIDALVRGASWCGQVEGCEGESLDSAPEHTIGVEVYDAASMVLLTASTATNGRIDIDVEGANFGDSLILHVFSPTAVAAFPYELHIDVRDYAGDDPCSCG